MLDAAASADLTIAVGDESPAQVVARILDATRWVDRIHTATPFALSKAECQ